MKTIKIIIAIIFAIAAPRYAAGQEADAVYLIGTASSDLAAWSPENKAGFYKMPSFSDPANEYSFIFHSAAVGDQDFEQYYWDQWFSHYKRPVLERPLADLPNYLAQDIEDELAGRTKIQALEWAQRHRGKKVYIIDRNDFFNSAGDPNAEPDMMILQRCT